MLLLLKATVRSVVLWRVSPITLTSDFWSLRTATMLIKRTLATPNSTLTNLRTGIWFAGGNGGRSGASQRLALFYLFNVWTLILLFWLYYCCMVLRFYYFTTVLGMWAVLLDRIFCFFFLDFQLISFIKKNSQLPVRFLLALIL